MQVDLTETEIEYLFFAMCRYHDLSKKDNAPFEKMVSIETLIRRLGNLRMVR